MISPLLNLDKNKDNVDKLDSEKGSLKFLTGNPHHVGVIFNVVVLLSCTRLVVPGGLRPCWFSSNSLHGEVPRVY